MEWINEDTSRRCINLVVGCLLVNEGWNFRGLFLASEEKLGALGRNKLPLRRWAFLTWLMTFPVPVGPASVSGSQPPAQLNGARCSSILNHPSPKCMEVPSLQRPFIKLQERRQVNLRAARLVLISSVYLRPFLAEWKAICSPSSPVTEGLPTWPLPLDFIGPLVFWGPAISPAPGGLLGVDAGAALVSSEDSVGVGPAICDGHTHRPKSEGPGLG